MKADPMEPVGTVRALILRRCSLLALRLQARNVRDTLVRHLPENGRSTGIGDGSGQSPALLDPFTHVLDRIISHDTKRIHSQGAPRSFRSAPAAL